MTSKQQLFIDTCCMETEDHKHFYVYSDKWDCNVIQMKELKQDGYKFSLSMISFGGRFKSWFESR